MYVDFDEEIASAIDDMLPKAIEDYLAAGGDKIITFAEYQELMERLKSVEHELKEQNFWKADRNHSHKPSIEDHEI